MVPEDYTKTLSEDNCHQTPPTSPKSLKVGIDFTNDDHVMRIESNSTAASYNPIQKKVLFTVTKKKRVTFSQFPIK